MSLSLYAPGRLGAVAIGLPILVARALANSPRQVQRAFEEVGETSFSAVLREARLRAAAELRSQQPLTVREVSFLVGYRQPPHFARAFRRRWGVTPAQYRHRARRARTDMRRDQGGQQ